MRNIPRMYEQTGENRDISIFYYSLQGLLPTGHLLASNVKIRSLSLVTDGPLIIEQQQLTDCELRVLLPILKAFPTYCPYDVLLANISSASVTQNTIKQWRQRLEVAQKDGTWPQELRPLRRALSSLRNKLHSFDLEISTVRERGCSLTGLIPVNP